MAVRDDCRHYLLRTTPSGEAMRRCRLNANDDSPFACPDGCLFYERRAIQGAGWAQAPSRPMSNTAANLPETPKRKWRGKGKGKRRR